MTILYVGSNPIHLEALEQIGEENLELFKMNFPGELSTYLWASIKLAFRMEAFRATPNVLTYSRVKLFQRALMEGNLELVKTYIQGDN